MNKDAPVMKNRVIFPNDKDKSLFLDIDNVVTTISNHFNGLNDEDCQITTEEILEILKRTSFNIENTFNYFKKLLWVFLYFF